jgi:hypothetical protein
MQSVAGNVLETLYLLWIILWLLEVVAADQMQQTGLRQVEAGLEAFYTDRCPYPMEFHIQLQ